MYPTLSASKCRRDLFKNVKDETNWKYSKATIWMHIKKNIEDLAVTKE